MAPPWMQKIGGLFSDPRVNGGVFGEPTAASPYDPRMAMASELLSQSGYAPYKRPFGEVLGRAMQAAQQARALGVDREQQKKVQEAQIAASNAQAANAGRDTVPAGATLVQDGKPVYTAPASETGTNSRYRSPQITQSRRLVIQDGQTGRAIYSDSGEPWDGAEDPISRDLKLQTMPDGSVIAVDVSAGIGEGGPHASTVVDRETAIEGASERASAETTAKSQAARYDTFISEGYRAADALPNLNRAIELLDSVETGGFSAAQLAMTNFLGVTGADEAELSANAGKAVLSQLRTIFGSAFTEGEGKRLIEIEAGFGKSTEGNRRLLDQARKITERAARRGISAARRTGQDYDADEIERAMQMKLTPTAAPVELDPETQALVDKYGTAEGAR